MIKGDFVRRFYGKIIITKHAKDRFIQRWIKSNNKRNYINVYKNVQYDCKKQAN